MTTFTRASSGLDSFSIQQTQNRQSETRQNNFFGEDGFTFGDIIDIINPLQHIPVIGSIYRKITGDTIAPAMQIAGGALFGGPIGAAFSLVSTSIQSTFKQNNADPNSPNNIETHGQIAETKTPPPAFTNISQKDYSKSEPATSVKTNSVSLKMKLPLINRQMVYQPADGIVNMAYIETQRLDDRLSANKDSNLDVVAGEKTRYDLKI